MDMAVVEQLCQALREGKPVTLLSDLGPEGLYQLPVVRTEAELMEQLQDRYVTLAFIGEPLKIQDGPYAKEGLK